MTTTAGKRILVIAGPNGAGKTTFARELLPNEARCPVFVNADLIAAGLSPFGAGSVTVQASRSQPVTSRSPTCRRELRTCAYCPLIERVVAARAPSRVTDSIQQFRQGGE